MAAPLKLWLLRRIPALFSKFAVTTDILGGKTTYRLRLNQLASHTARQLEHSRLAPLTSLVLFRGFGEKQVDHVSVRHGDGIGKQNSCSRSFSDGHGKSGSDNNRRPLKLMDFEELIWPNPLKSVRNTFFSFLIKWYFDTHFTNKSFLDGSEQAMNYVSHLISNGKFSELDGLVTQEAQREIKRHFNQLSTEQRQFVAINPKDIFFRFIHEIGIILDDKTNERFVEITAVFQGIHGLEKARDRNPESFSEDLRHAHDQVYVCNYRFVREYTKGKEDDWIINKLNHFKAKEVVEQSSLFRR